MEPVPGREQFLEFVAKASAMSRTRFLGKHVKPVILITSATGARALSSHTTDIVTPRPNATPAPLPYFLYEVAKRPGANDTPAITVGRAPTNDVIIEDPGVSRIHAAIFAQKDGKWTIADASSSGTWVESEKLAPKKHRWLGDKTQLRFGPAVFATFMSPERLFELVAKTLPH